MEKQSNLIARLRKEVYNRFTCTFDKKRVAYYAIPKFRQMDYDTAMKAIDKTGSGVMCSDCAHLFIMLLEKHDIKAYTYDFGIQEGALTHATTLVNNNTRLELHDSYFDGVYVDAINQEPLDFREICNRLKKREHSSIFFKHDVAGICKKIVGNSQYTTLEHSASHIFLSRVVTDVTALYNNYTSLNHKCRNCTSTDCCRAELIHWVNNNAYYRKIWLKYIKNKGVPDYWMYMILEQINSKKNEWEKD